MQINEILCTETGRTISADRIYKVNSNTKDCIETIVSKCYLCPYSEHGREINKACTKCYGSIVQKRETINNKKAGRNNMLTEIYRNTFEKDDEDDILKNMSADDFMEHIEIVANLNSLNWNHGQKTDDKLRAYDKPKTWKTDCIECKIKNEKTKCQLAKEYLENKFGMSVEFMTEKQLSSEIPTEFMCQNQAQTVYYV